MAPYVRTEESTYLTFPEWYLVFNPQEYAAFLAKNKPSRFPYFRSIGQFWSGYCQVYGATKNHYPFNAGDHLTIGVIGVSFTLEYAVKGIYENTLGRLTEWVSGHQTAEDRYAAKVAKRYGEFIPDWPWYEFDYGKAFVGVWKDTGWFGKSMLRKAERKLALSFENGIKFVYAKLIKWGTRSVYGVADTEVYVLVTAPSESTLNMEGVRVIKALVDGSFLITLPHYQGFTETAPMVAKAGIDFVSIAGNDEILLSVVGPRGVEVSEGHLLFKQTILTDKKRERQVLQVPVTELSKMLNNLKQNKLQLEHIFDY